MTKKIAFLIVAAMMGLVEVLYRAAGAFAGTRSRIETAVPFPRLCIVRIAAALRDRAGVDTAVIDQPALLVVVVFRSAASEGGHAH